MKLWTDDEARETFARWARGDCCCCGGGLDNEGIHGEQAIEIGEGVRICGFCVYRRHDAADVAPVLLEQLLVGRP